MVPEVETEPTWAQGPGDFEFREPRTRPRPQRLVLIVFPLPYEK
jgi:hypothetical protein